MSELAPGIDDRLDHFIDVLGNGLRSDTQRAAFTRYVVGLMSDAERKSVEPIAARSRPDAANAEHCALLYFVNKAPWNDRAVRRSAAAWALMAATVASPVRCTIIDDTGFIKKGRHSVGVARQYTGSSGRIDNCQVAVSLSVATDYDTVPIDFGLYLPWEWTQAMHERWKGKIPHELEHAPKWQMAIEMLKAAHADRVPLGEVVLADAAYGRVTEFRTAITDLGLHYGVAVPSTQHVFVDGKTQQVDAVAKRTRADRWRNVRWREEQRGIQTGRFAFRRVRVGEEPGVAHEDGPEVWLVTEWCDGDEAPSKYYLSTRPRAWSHSALVAELKQRWRTEVLYEEMKGELGLDHYEGRGWTGWNHHVSVVMCCYALLVGERVVAFPPCEIALRRALSYRRAA